ncbi:protein of unknown function [Denitratisoma oestradiolicum]|uniref:Uncharacterized protein n=1 Tax=Denitratisoma oestradiolicum TaxID=311182 RepID=A0A6S6XZQ9_9PROT|nr:protein of unknown function [Denitratisoma oestradiolicum]
MLKRNVTFCDVKPRFRHDAGISLKPLKPAPILGNLVGAIGLEPTTPTMSRWCSNQLSYAPVKEARILLEKRSLSKGGGRLKRLQRRTGGN